MRNRYINQLVIWKFVYLICKVDSVFGIQIIVTVAFILRADLVSRTNVHLLVFHLTLADCIISFITMPMETVWRLVTEVQLNLKLTYRWVSQRCQQFVGSPVSDGCLVMGKQGKWQPCPGWVNTWRLVDKVNVDYLQLRHSTLEWFETLKCYL